MAPPAPRGRPGRSADRARGAREAHVRLRQGRGCARSAAGSWPRRGFKCIPGAGARGPGSEFSPAQPLLRSPAWPAAPGTLLLGPLARDGPPAGGRDPGSGSPPAPGPRPRAPPSPTWKLRLEKKSDFLSTLLGVESGIRRKLLQPPACALAVSPRSAEEKQLPPKSCLPLPPKAPLRFVKRGARSAKYLSPRDKRSVTAPNERWVLFR